MRRYEDLCREPGYFLWPLISEITKPLIAAKNFSLLAETGFFNRIGQLQTYSSKENGPFWGRNHA
jgi:hypothetical protein